MRTINHFSSLTRGRRWRSQGRLGVTIWSRGSLDCSSDPSFAFLSSHDEVLEPRSALRRVRGSGGKPSDDGIAPWATRRRPVLINVTLVDLPVPDLVLGYRRRGRKGGLRAWLLWSELLGEGGRPAVKLAGHWLLRTAPHALHLIPRPSFGVRLPDNVGDTKYSNGSADETFSRPHVEAKVQTCVPLVLELAWVQLRLGDLEANVLAELGDGGVALPSLHHGHGCVAVLAHSTSRNETCCVAHHPWNHGTPQMDLLLQPHFQCGPQSTYLTFNVLDRSFH